MCVSVRTGVACVWLRAMCASVCVWNVLSVCVMRLVCRPGVSMKILNVKSIQLQKRVSELPNVSPVAAQAVSGCASWFEDLHKYKYNSKRLYTGQFIDLRSV